MRPMQHFIHFSTCISKSLKTFRIFSFKTDVDKKRKAYILIFQIKGSLFDCEKSYEWYFWQLLMFKIW